MAVLFVIPGIVRQADSNESLLTSVNEASIGGFFKSGSVAKITAQSPFMEGEVLAMESVDPVSDGPLYASAFGMDLPAKFPKFRVSVYEASNDAFQVPRELAVQERTFIADALRKLDTPRFRVQVGNGFDHAAAWMSEAEFNTHGLIGANETEYRRRLPEGDGETLLRQFIDDSRDLLLDCEVNRIRNDEGHPPISVFWPWAHGPTPKVTPVSLRIGTPLTVIADDLRMLGISRLAQAEVMHLSEFGSRLKWDWKALFKSSFRNVTVVYLTQFRQLVSENLDEEARWLYQEFLTELALAVPETQGGQSGNNGTISRVSLALLGESSGLAIQFGSGASGRNETDLSPVPNRLGIFDERLLEENWVKKISMFQLIGGMLDGKGTTGS